jgi:hypothetical protein
MTLLRGHGSPKSSSHNSLPMTAQTTSPGLPTKIDGRAATTTKVQNPRILPMFRPAVPALASSQKQFLHHSGCRSSQSHRDDIEAFDFTPTSRRLPLFRLQVQNLRRQRENWRVFRLDDRRFPARGVGITAPSLPSPSFHGDGVQIREVEAVAIVDAFVLAAVEGLCDW